MLGMGDMGGTTLTPVIMTTNTPRPIITIPIIPTPRATITILIPKDTGSGMSTSTLNAGRLVGRVMGKDPKAVAMAPDPDSV